MVSSLHLVSLNNFLPNLYIKMYGSVYCILSQYKLEVNASHSSRPTTPNVKW